MDTLRIKKEIPMLEYIIHLQLLREIRNPIGIEKILIIKLKIIVSFVPCKNDKCFNTSLAKHDVGSLKNKILPHRNILQI